MKKRAEGKHPNLTAIVRAALASDGVRLSEHARERMIERSITVADIRHVLGHGRHEPQKDAHDREWKYAYRGSSIDGRILRIVFTVKTPGVLVVTVIALGR